MVTRPDPQEIRPIGAELEKVEQTETVHHESSAKRRPVQKGVRQLNLTAMLDVTFQLLIFFVLTASFAINEGILPADLPTGPTAQQQQAPPQEPVVIVLRPIGVDGVSIWLERSENIPDGDFVRLYEKLNGWRYDEQTNPTGMLTDDNPIIIKPNEDVQWNHVVNAFNAVRRARYTNVSFAQAGGSGA